MGNVRSTLTMSLIDGISGPAKGVERSLKGLQNSARATERSGQGAGGAKFLAGGGRLLMGAAATYLTGQTAKQAFNDYAGFDRQITRILNTADATRAQGQATKNAIYSIANETALPVRDVTEGLETLVAMGNNLPQSLEFLPQIARTAQAAGASVTDIASTANAMSKSLGFTAKQMDGVFDVLVAGGKAGTFELKDMAQYLPGIAPAAAAIGLKGEAGLRKLVAALQIVRAQTGESSSAATNLQNVFQKMETEETVKKFAKFGVDVPKAMKAARKDGKDLLSVFLDLSDKALKGDLSKIPQLFADAQVSAGMRALLSQRQELKRLTDELAHSGGAVARDIVGPTTDAQAAIVRLDNAWTHFLQSAGRAVDAAGISTLLEGIATKADAGAGNVERLLDNVKKLGIVGGATKFFDDNSQAQDKAAKDVMTAIQDAQAQEATRREIGTLSAELDKRRGTFATTDKRIQDRFKSKPIPPEIAAQRQSALDEIRGLEGQLTSAIARSLPRPRQLPPTVPDEYQAYSPRYLGQRLSGASRSTAGKVQAGEAMLGVVLDNASLTAAAAQARNRIQAILSANPVTVPVRAGDVSGLSHALGRSITSELDGSFTDNGGRR